MQSIAMRAISFRTATGTRAIWHASHSQASPAPHPFIFAA
jgi:hypothetical protein